MWHSLSCSRGQSKKTRKAQVEVERWAGEEEGGWSEREMGSWRVLRKRAPSRSYLVGTPFFLLFLAPFLRGILSAPSQLPFPQDCHQWRALLDHLEKGGGVKNIMHERGPAKINGTFSSHVFSLLSFHIQYGLIYALTSSSPMYLQSWASRKRNFSCMWGRYDSCHSHLLPCPCSVNITSTGGGWQRDLEGRGTALLLLLWPWSPHFNFASCFFF